MARLITLECNKSYATVENAVKAVEKKFPMADNDGLTYILQQTPEGRFFPVFLGERSPCSLRASRSRTISPIASLQTSKSPEPAYAFSSRCRMSAALSARHSLGHRRPSAVSPLRHILQLAISPAFHGYAALASSSAFLCRKIFTRPSKLLATR
jgi:hypothetical protein